MGEDDNILTQRWLISELCKLKFFVGIPVQVKNRAAQHIYHPPIIS